MGHFRVWARKGGGSLASRPSEGGSSFKGKKLGRDAERSPPPGTPAVRLGDLGTLSGAKQTEAARRTQLHRHPGSCPRQPPTLPSGPRVVRAWPSSRADSWILEVLPTSRGPRHRRQGGTQEREGDRQVQGDTRSAAALTTNAEFPGKPPAMTSLPAAERKLRREARGRAPLRALVARKRGRGVASLPESREEENDML